MSWESEIPDKLYFKIGEVSKLLDVKPYVLRYWETEFNDISPLKSRTNQRLYKRRDVEFLMQIKELLYKHRFTISGAKQKLKEHKQKKSVVSPKTSNQMGFFSDEENKEKEAHSSSVEQDLSVSSEKLDSLKEKMIQLKEEIQVFLKEI